ncbi:hypothetical protein AX16_002722 [Volvariella volvacea WC 439]|nr:hypothetical protein AX16_002722 [Volvariella volvacea WC 439]
MFVIAPGIKQSRHQIRANPSTHSTVAMFRVATKLPRRYYLAGAAVASIAVTTPPSEEKLSIYPTQTADIVLQEDPSPLEQQIGVARRQVTQSLQNTHAGVQELVSKWIGIEHAVENRIKSIISPSEPLTPGLLYVGVATLSGSIIGRNRFILTRLFLPPAFFFLSLNYFLPKTSHNLSDYLGSLEDTYFPTVSQKHEIAKAHTIMGWEMLKETTKDGRKRLTEGTVSLVEKIQESTGLKLKDAFSVETKKVESKVLDAVKAHEEEKKSD